MTSPPDQEVVRAFRQSIAECQQLYRSCARLCIEQYASFLPGTPDHFLQLMDDLHKGLLIKVYVSVVEADQRWSREEKALGRALFEHIWPGGVPGGKLREAAQHIFREAQDLQWYALVRPFNEIAPLRDYVGELQTIVVRLANLVAKADGAMNDGEEERLREIQQELDLHLGTLDFDLQPTEQQEAGGAQAVQIMEQDAGELRRQYEIQSEAEIKVENKSREERLAEALARLDELIGLEQVKHEIRTLTNFLTLQQQRAAAGLPRTELSLHMVFGGNPGTGKTTVARIVGAIFGAMGILDKGHLVETDRSGLVAEYAGQTGPKTSKRIDEALDGVLFIDEAYSLVAQSGDDPYGREAVQTLLKRMEDDRQRLVVILAGYPDEMDTLLRSNPGLSSRFNTKLTFEDYSPGDLGRIFGSLCERNHYVLPPETRERALLSFAWLYEHRDSHFGNGRLVRNAFEDAVRRLANRIAGVTPLSHDLLTTLRPEDIVVDGVPSDFTKQQTNGVRYRVSCPGCQDEKQVRADYLGRRVRCHHCDKRFTIEWAEPELDP